MIAYVAGENQKYIAEESIVVAACQPNPDKVFLKQIKSMQVMFGYDIPSVTNSEPSQKVSNNIEEWEIDLWRSSFDRVFPKAGLFPGAKCKPSKEGQGPLVVLGASEVKPDYRYPNRTIKVGDTWQRAMPQLVWFAMHENVEVCRNLIEKGADVNVMSEVGDTPILMAVQALNVTEIPWTSLNDDLFKLISSLDHTGEVINTRTQKKRLLPIISAVQTGRVDVVERILEMGADPNGRGLTDEQTALNVCIKLIGAIRNPIKFWETQNAMPITPEVLDSIRRHSSGLSGFSLDHQQRYMQNTNNDSQFVKIMNVVKDLYIKRLMENLTIDDLREIAIRLIRAGGNVNAEHASPLKGYTPLMLAVELDEKAIFEHMLISGGDIKKTYKHPRTGRDISILDIAKGFKSTGIMQVLKHISPYATVQ